MMSFNQFYRKSKEERLAIIQDYIEDTIPQLQSEIADQMIENYVYSYTLPLGVVPNVCVNGKRYVVPMVTEEPSVVAAASNGTKRLGNITAITSSRELIGQIVLIPEKNPQEVLNILTNAIPKLLTVSTELVPNMVKRGGGPTRMWANTKEQFVTLYVGLNPCDAMGANVMNTLLEQLSSHIQQLTHSEALLNILSNYNESSLTTAKVSIPFEIIGHEIARKIALASQYAQLDPYRAATHNKGIMNGIDAIVVATGNDWRAVEASIHSYASRTGQYKGLAQWTINEEAATLEGELTLPLPIATVGGTLSVHPTAQLSLKLMKCDNATELANIIASIGLAQNFAALRALVTVGIQKGHMAMQARSLALQVGATVEEVPILVAKLRKNGDIQRHVAEKLLSQMRDNKKN